MARPREQETRRPAAGAWPALFARAFLAFVFLGLPPQAAAAAAGRLGDRLPRARPAELVAGAAANPGPAAPSINPHAALGSVPAIGRGPLGDGGYERPRRRLEPGEQAVVVADAAAAAAGGRAQERPGAGRRGGDAAGAALLPGSFDEPPWQRIWRAKAWDIGVTAAALLLLTAIFFFQDQLVRRPVLYRWVRRGFLLWTLVWLGWYANAQLSVVNVLTFTNALLTGFDWGRFLSAPLVFILWTGVAASLIFWGRGVFCGWLCPFGAMQELLAAAAQRLKVPQISVPWGLHERLWPVKYVVFLGLFGASLHSVALAERLAEVEPFKTAVILKFMREWPFTLYAVGLLAAGLFIERFFCRYLCPLGAALAIPGKMRTFEWLKRWQECGSPCQRCARECPVQSIHPEGNINPNECIYCMRCQELYRAEDRCPHNVQRRLKRENQAAMSAVPLPGRGKGPPKTAITRNGKPAEAPPKAPVSGAAPAA